MLTCEKQLSPTDPLDHSKPNPDWQGSQAKGLLTAILELGAFFGSLISGPFADIFSRKASANKQPSRSVGLSSSHQC